MIRHRPRAVYTIIEFATYIGEDSPAASGRFLNAVEATIRQIHDLPGIGRRYDTSEPRLAGLRVWSVKGFRNYLIFYRVASDGIEIVTLLHGARDIDRALLDEL